MASSNSRFEKKLDVEVNKLTEFGPVPESPESSFSWSNIFKWNRPDKASSFLNKPHASGSSVVRGFHYSSKDGSVVEVEQVENPIVAETRRTSKSSSSEQEVHAVSKFANIFRKISNALDRNSNSQMADHNDFKQYWMADSDCKECYDCGDKFTTFRRRHHCRICGQVFCSSCCNQEIPGKLLQINLRVCAYCCKVFLSCLQSAETAEESEVDVKNLQDQLKTRLGVIALSQNRSQKRKIGSFNEISVNIANHSHGQSSSFQEKKSIETRTADDNGQFPIDNSHFGADSNRGVDDVSTCGSYRESAERSISDDLEPSWVSRVHHKTGESLWDSNDESQCQDADVRSSVEAGNSSSSHSGAVYRNPDKTVKIENYRNFRSSYDNQQFAIRDNAMRAGAFNASAVAAAEGNSFCLNLKSGEFDQEKHEVSLKLREIYEKYERHMINQLLIRHNLPPTWAEVILLLTQQVVKNVRVNSERHRGEMDIRPSVQIKKIAGGEMSDSTIVTGAVFTKNITHKKMRSCINSPTILLIKSPIIYQRQENKFVSLEPALLQETSYLRNIVAKIIALRPDVVLVESTVSRIAQNFFLDADITLLLNVKSSVMNRVARLTNAHVLTSVDAHFARPQLGTCKMMRLTDYYLPNGTMKTLLMFDGCEPHVGCTILIRGALNSDLCKVKRIMKFMLFMKYNQKLERSFLCDELALPSPNGNVEFLNDSYDTLPRHLQDTSEIISSLNYNNSIDPENKLNLTNVIDESVDESDNHELFLKGLQQKFQSLAEALTFVKLSVSPNINFKVPGPERTEYLAYFPDLAFHSPYLNETIVKYCDDDDESLSSYTPQRHLSPRFLQLDLHPFLKTEFNHAVYQNHVQCLLSNYRATAMCSLVASFEESWAQESCTSDNLTNYDYEDKPDVLDPFNHQSLSVLFCSYSYKSSNSPYFCIDPWIVRMDFYGMNDVTLGGFLEKYCFRTSYTCPSSTCDAPMLDHIRRFVHSKGCVFILLHKMETPLSFCSPDTFIVWNWCRKCKVSSRPSVMSTEARALSFAKFLELKFHTHNYVDINRSVEGVCQHSLHRDNYQYFACKDVIAAFKYSSVPVNEIKLPENILLKKPQSTVRYMSNQASEESLVDVIRTLAVSGHGIFDTIVEKLQGLSSELPSSKTELFLDKSSQLQHEKNQFCDKVKDIQIKLTSVNQNEQSECWEIIDSIVMLKRHLVEAVISWNLRLNDCLQLRRKEEKLAKQLIVKSVALTSAVDQPHHEADTSSTSCLKIGDANLAVYTESGEDDKGSQTLDEPCYDHYCEVSSEITQVTDVGDRSSNQSFESADGKSSSVEAAAVGIEKESGIETPKNEKKSGLLVKNMLSQLLSSPSAVNLSMPFPPNEHHMLPHCEKIPLVVYEDEPSSIIAYTLSSADYELGLQNMVNVPESSNKATPPKDNKDSNSSIKSSKSSRSSEKRCDSVEDKLEVKDIPDVVEDGADPAAKSTKLNPPRPLEVQFTDYTTKFSVGVFFPKKFRELRDRILPEGEETFIRSLSRCFEWQANGGKSGCLFCKTHDDRFILKQMGRLEAQQFLEFAPQYIDYILEATDNNRPVALAKILGAYHLEVRLINHSNPHVKMDLLVMENLFYGHEINKAFDLKGSIRNRLVDINGKNFVGNDSNVVVLQDENLLKMACDYPLYVRLHSKMILAYAIENDTRFLSDHSVMDYSLLVGVDEKKEKLIVGIIDYIRTFTWDKRLENLVKSSGILGGQGRLPTVVSPELYRNRFCEAMDRYILLVPDQWSEIGPMNL
ncbi:1-phosphatidylinositol-3-phosphate 5-kinase [Chamberlinius hualienensis]